jgi:hypothetical protein
VRMRPLRRSSSVRWPWSLNARLVSNEVKAR